MAKMTYHEHWPYYVTPPGETILDGIEYYKMSEAELASAIGTTVQVAHDLIRGKALLTVEIAKGLEKLFGVSARFWNNMERGYRKSVAREEEEGPFEGLVGWLDGVPMEEMVELDWLLEFDEDDGPVEKLTDVLHFFRVPSPGEWRKEWAYLQPQADALATDLVALSAWLRQGEWATKDIDCQPYDEYCFRQALQQIGLLTHQPLEAVLDQVVALCARSGVAVGLIPTLSGMNVHGVTRWLIPERALIQFAPADDMPQQLWHRFFHQAAHLLLHTRPDATRAEGRQKDYFEGSHVEPTPEEQEANHFAAQMLHFEQTALPKVVSGVTGAVRGHERVVA